MAAELPPDPDDDAIPPALALALEVHGDEPIWIMDKDRRADAHHAR